MSEEVWRDVPGYEGYYQVSNFGRIKSLSRMRKNGYFYKERILKDYVTRGGYKRIMLCDEMMNKKRYMVHRLVASAFLTNPNHYPQINHKDENPQNNNVTNLEWCTAKYNNNYGKKQSKVCGEKNTQHKLTEKQVIEIRRRHKDDPQKNTQTILSKEYGVSRRAINFILSGQKWKYCIKET